MADGRAPGGGSDGDDGFAARWSRRKQAARQGLALPEAAPPVVAPLPVAAAAPAVPAGPVEAPPLVAAPAPPPPTLDDVAELTRESDYSRFIAPGVDAQVKNAAMKKLFTDPHFNVMDGLDIYIDDYNTAEPLPKSMLRQMVQARALGLLDDELVEQDKPADTAPSPPHENADLQLQPDDAPGCDGADEGPGADDGGSPA